MVNEYTPHLGAPARRSERRTWTPNQAIQACSDASTTKRWASIAVCLALAVSSLSGCAARSDQIESNTEKALTETLGGVSIGALIGLGLAIRAVAWISTPEGYRLSAKVGNSFWRSVVGTANWALDLLPGFDDPDDALGALNTDSTQSKNAATGLATSVALAAIQEALPPDHPTSVFAKLAEKSKSQEGCKKPDGTPHSHGETCTEEGLKCGVYAAQGDNTIFVEQKDGPPKKLYYVTHYALECTCVNGAWQECVDL